MRFTLSTAEIPSLITWFNGFIGFREIQKRIERVDAKLRDIGLVVPALNQRYYFHSTYRKLVIRNRTYRKIDITDYDNNRAISLIASIKEFTKLLDVPQRERLRARLIESLDPDRDIRELAHEMRAFVHYRRAGLMILPSDSHDERFDFLVRGRGEFEVECKTFSENIGSAISIDDSVHIFRAFKRAYDQNKAFLENGIITMTFPKRVTLSENDAAAAIAEFLSDAPANRYCEAYTIEFERRLDWDSMIRANNRKAILDSVATRFAQNNSHFVANVSKEHAFMFAIQSNRNARPAKAIFSRLKSASEQFSKTRPAVIWGHFLGLDEDDFKEILEREKLGHRAFDVFANYLFKDKGRNHICRLRLSADGEIVRSMRPLNSAIIQPAGTIGGGPAYDLTSKVSKFDPILTEQD
jgi:hypothetical protein